MAENEFSLGDRAPWKLSREEYIAYLQTLEPQDWFNETQDYGFLVQCAFDVLAMRLTLTYDLGKHTPSHLHQVVFDGVRALYHETGRNGILDEPESELAWDSTKFRATGVGVIAMSAEGMQVFADPALNRGYIDAVKEIPHSVPNFILSLGAYHGTLNIEANRVTIDGRIFEVGYPTPWRKQ